MSIFMTKDSEGKEMGVITADNGFIVVIKNEFHGPFPYSMKEKILNLFRSGCNN